MSLFINADLKQVACAKALGADMIELHTGRYAVLMRHARGQEIARLKKASALAQNVGLRVHAGHGLDYDNVQPVAKIHGMEELNIGFSIISRALYSGLGTAVQAMKELITCVAS